MGLGGLTRESQPSSATPSGLDLSGFARQRPASEGDRPIFGDPVPAYSAKIGTVPHDATVLPTAYRDGGD